MSKYPIILLLAMIPCIAAADGKIYGRNDSIAIERILKKHSAAVYGSKGERVLAIAEEFIGAAYVGATLENGKEEPLFVSCSELDCSTFVELTAAISVTIDGKEHSFDAVCRNLERIRYRGGKRDGYASRLHYTSWWIDDNTEKGLVQEVTASTEHRKRRSSLFFMSMNSDKYGMLENDTEMQATIKALEAPYQDIEVKYIPKEWLDRERSTLKIADGDIIALVTTIDGLDISHVGFAFWKDGKLHLLHASSAEGKVIMDTTTLYDYQKNKRTQIGIRVLRIL